MAEAHPIKVIEYDRLFVDANPGRETDFLQFLNKDSIQIKHAYAEPDLATWQEGEVCQFERIGYYCVNHSVNGIATTFHRVVNLRDSWGKIA